MTTEYTFPDNETFGTRLKKARESLGLSIQDIAQQLRLNCDIIEKIEAEDWTSSRHTVFIRGYIASYAKILKIAPDETERALIKLKVYESRPIKVEPMRQNPSLLVKPMKIIAPLLGITIIGILVWAFQSKRSVPKSHVKQPMLTAKSSTQQKPIETKPTQHTDVKPVVKDKVDETLNTPQTKESIVAALPEPGLDDQRNLGDNHSA